MIEPELESWEKGAVQLFYIGRSGWIAPPPDLSPTCIAEPGVGAAIEPERAGARAVMA